MEYNNLIYIIIILGLTYLFYQKLIEKQTNTEKSYNLPNLSEIENKTRKNLESISNKNQQFFFYPGNEHTTERLDVDKIVRTYLYF